MATAKKWFLNTLDVITDILEKMLIVFVVFSILFGCLCYWWFEHVMF